MEQLDILLLIFLGLWLVGWVVVCVLVRKYLKHHKTKSVDEGAPIDMPGMYDDVDYSERPFITYN